MELIQNLNTVLDCNDFDFIKTLCDDSEV